MSLFKPLFDYKCIFFADRIVLIGNHRDAWVYGAADPSSGTAAMVETARVIGSLKSRGKIILHNQLYPFDSQLS